MPTRRATTTRRLQATTRPYVHDFIAAVPKEAHVLDLGCGTGQWSLAMAKAGLLVHARDASREMLALVAEHANLTKTQATFDDLSEDNTFDGVFASFSLLHAPRDDMPRHLSLDRACVETMRAPLSGDENGQRRGAR